ncbi:hypothetical protein IVB36_31670 [Bradyrhizobium sp. 35]|uniref:hypothetical protein n=1 Tax=Bradyrhizobium sp. 35 TaxID=2782670 RepID=UPI001FFB8A7F|nr:hypothetical protein [Bradyrhizobium sp. 35]MCK1455303.1 hypothetical protein [Bradyrhizobium sp. 35]
MVWKTTSSSRGASPRGRSEGIFVTPFEQGEIAPDLFWAACRIEIEDLISKRRKCAYKGSRCEH